MLNLNKNQSKVSLWSIVLVLVFSMVLAACGNNNTANSGNNTGNSPGTNEGKASEEVVKEEVKEEPLDVSIMAHFFLDAPPDKESEVQKRIEEALNVNFDIQWVSHNNYVDRFNVTLASGNLPDLMYVRDPFASVVRDAVEQGAFWDITPYYKDYPNLTKELSENAWELTKMKDGKNYGVPRPRPAQGETFFTIRKDWLDKLNLEVPTTTEELYAVMKAFVDNDMSGDGKTVGFTGYVNVDDMGSFASFVGGFTGANGDWKLDGNELKFVDLLPENKEALEYLRSAYQEGLLPADFASLRPSQAVDIYKAGRAGIVVEKTASISEYLTTLGTGDPASDANLLYPLTSVNGYNPSASGFNGMLAIPKSVSEEKMKQILAMLNNWMSAEVYDIQAWGIEGVHHNVVDGNKVIIEEQFTKDSIPNYNQIVFKHGPYASSYGDHHPEQFKEVFGKVQDERAKSSVPEYSKGLYSEASQTYLPDIKKKSQDLKTKIILGSAPITAWDDYVNELKNDSKMNQIIEEINAAYTARSQK